MDHIHTNNLMEPLQSVYRPHHSTDTALFKVKADILKAMDNQEITCLVLLDLSAAFDMVDHKIPLNQLESPFWNQGNGSLMDRIIPYELVSESGDWRYEKNRCQIRECESKVWCATRQCIGTNFVHSLYLFTWSNMCQTCSLPSLCWQPADLPQFQTRAYWGTVSSRWLYSLDRKMH